MSAVPAAAWYPDPTGAAELRWWDGSSWTEHVHPPVEREPAELPTDAEVVDHPLRVVRDPGMWTSFPERVTGVATVAKLEDGELAESNRIAVRRLVIMGVVAVVAMTVLPGPLVLVVVGLLGAWAVVDHVRNGLDMPEVLASWSAERGLESLASAADDRARPALDTLRVAGTELRVVRCSGVGGPLWGAAPDALLVDVVHETGEHAGTMSFVAIELPADVAARYPGVAITVFPPGALGSFMRLGSKAHSGGWARQSFERSVPHLEVRAAPEQDQLALFELVDVRLLEELARRGSTVSLLGFGFAIAGGRLVAWREGSSLDCVRLRARRSPDAAKVADADARLEAWLDTVRTMHRRLLEEYQ